MLNGESNENGIKINKSIKSGGHAISIQIKTWVDWISLHWYACGADGRSVYGHVITKFSRMGSLPHFLTHHAPPELRYKCNLLQNLDF